MEKEYCNGRMDLNILDIEVMIKLMEKDDLFNQMEIFMKDNDLMVRLMDMELIYTVMVVNIQVLGRMIINKD